MNLDMLRSSICARVAPVRGTVEPAIDGNPWLSTSSSGDKDSIPNNSNEKIPR